MNNFKKYILIICTLVASPSIYSQSLQYNYDNLNRIIQTVFSDGRIVNYSYDDLGNRISMVVNDGIPENLPISNLILTNGANECFNAYDTITVAGTNPVIIESGSSVELIAGKSIRFLPGFHSKSGSFMDAHITTDSTFCDGASAAILEQPVEKSITEQFAHEKQTVVPGVKSIKVYPNPNNGQFTFEFTNIERGANVSIYNMLGARVYNSTATNLSGNKIKLSGIRKGIYFVTVTDGNEQLTRKMMVN
jgi:YD repeat-containing protein